MDDRFSDAVPPLKSYDDDLLRAGKEAGFDMSAFTPADPLTRRGYREVTDEDKKVTWGDYGRAIAGGAAGVLSGVGALTEYATDGKAGGGMRRYFEEAAQGQQEKMGPAARRALNAEVLPGEGEASVLENWTSSLGLKSASAIPSVVAAILPGGLVGAVVRGAAGTAAGAVAAGGVSRVTAGALNAGDLVQQIYSDIEKINDEDLQRRAPIYAGYRSMMDERSARQLYMKDVADAAPIAAFALSSLTGGIESQVARRLGGEAAKGVLRGAAKGALAEATQETLESGGNEYLAQGQMLGAGLDDMNWQKILSKAIEGGAVGGVMGGAMGGAANIGRRSSTPVELDPAQGNIAPDLAQTLTSQVNGNPPPTPSPAPAAAAPVAPATGAAPATEGLATTAPVQPKGAGTGTAAKPVDNATVQGNPESAPTRSGTRYPKEAAPGPAEAPPLPAQSVGDVPADVADALIRKTSPTGAEPAVATPTAPVLPPVPQDLADSYTRQTAGTSPLPTMQDDTGGNIPESPKTLELQQRALVEGRVPAQMFPLGTKPLPLPQGMQAVTTKRGVFHFNPRLVSKNAVVMASRAGRENELLSLGPMSKSDVAASGQPQVAVTERNNGTEVASAVTTPNEVPATAQAVNERALPGSTVQVEPIENVLEGRGDRLRTMAQQSDERLKTVRDAMATGVAPPEYQQPATSKGKPAAPRVLRASGEQEFVPIGELDKNLTAKEKQKISQPLPEAAEKISKGSNWTKAEVEARAANNKIADQISAQFPASEAETRFRGRGKEATAAREAILKRAGAMAKAAMDGGWQEPKAIRTNANADMNHSVASLRIKGAVELLRKSAGKNLTADDFQRFLGRDAVLAKGGKDAFNTVTQDRREEGDRAMKQEATAEEAAVEQVDVFNAATPEQDLIAKQEQDEDDSAMDPAPPARERPKVVTEDKIAEVVTAGKDSSADIKSGKITVESKGRRKIARPMSQPAPAKAEEDIVARHSTQGGNWADELTTSVRNGRVAYVNGPVALIEAAAVNGTKIYVPARLHNGVPQMARVDVTSFNNKNGVFTEAQMKELLAAASHLQSMAEQPLPEGTIRLANGWTVTPDYTYDLDAALKKVNWTRYGPLRGVIRDRILQNVKGVKFYIVSPSDMAIAAGDTSTLGLYTSSQIYGERVFIRGDLEGEDAVHTMVHEAVHALVLRAMRKDPAAKAAVEAISREVKNYYRRNGGTPDYANYAFQDADEFLAEAWGNTKFQEDLQKIELSPQLARELGIKDWRGKTVWRAIIEYFTKLAGLPAGAVSAMEAIAKVTDTLADARPGLNPTENISAAMKERLPAGVVSAQINAGGKIRRSLDAVKTTYMIAREMIENTFQGTDAPMRAAQARRSIDMRRAKIVDEAGGEDLIRTHAELQRQDPASYEAMVDVGYQFTTLNANPGGEAANPHFGKNKRKFWQAREKLARLSAEFNALPSEYQQLLTDTSEVFKKIQNDASLLEIKQLLEKAGVNVPGLAEKIHTDGLTDADKTLFKTNRMVEEIDNAQAFKKIYGLYLPAMRRGTHIVSGRVEIKPPNTASFVVDPVTGKPEQDTLVFTGGGNAAQAERDVKAYLAGTDLTVTTIRTAYYDPVRPNVVLNKDDPNAIGRGLRVRMQTQFTEFVDSEAGALAVAEEMRGKGLKDVFAEPREEPLFRTKNVYAPDMDSINRSVNRDEGFRDLDQAGKSAIRQALREASVRFSGDNSLAHRKLYRRNVMGFSKDLPRNTQEYLGQASSYLARLEKQNQIDNAFNEMKAFLEANRYANPALTIRRREQYDTLMRRIYAPDEDSPGGQRAPIVKRLLQISMINKLAGVSWHVVNAHEPWTIGASYLAGRHKVGDVLNALRRTYSLIGAGGSVVSGAKDTLRAFSQDSGFTNYQEFFVANMKKSGADAGRVDRVSDMLEYLHSVGLFDREAGMEATRTVDPSSNRFGRGLDRADLMVRQMGQAMEAINRAVVGISAYELEYGRTNNHEMAKAYAFEAIHDTMGDYSNTNAAPIFKNNIGALALQFKKYGQKQYWLLGRTVAAMARGDREAMRQFTGYMFSTAVVAGMLGLPGLEFVKLGLMGAGLLGAGLDYDDFEDLVRSATANVLGKGLGEAVTKGSYRLINVDMSGRLGQDSLLTFGQPRSEKQADLKAWLFDTLGGAPAGTVISQIESVQKLVGGDYLAALEKSMIPKFGVDIVKAYRGTTVGKETASGRQSLAPYSAPEAAMRAVGFTPAREAEQGRMRARVGAQSKELEDARRQWTTQWIKATPNERARLWAKVEQWNKGKPQEARLTRADLDRAAKRREADQKNVVDTVVTNKRNRYLAEEAGRIYNLR